MLKYGVIFLMVFTMSLCFCETLKVGFFDQEPYIFKQSDGKVTGATVDFFEQYFVTKMGITIEWVGPLPVNRIYQMLDSSEIDAYVFGMKNPEREKKYLFSAHYYTLGKPTLTLLKTNPLKQVTKQEDMFNLRIGYIDGAFYPPIMKNDKIAIEMVKGVENKKNNFDKLLLGRIDAILDLSEHAMPYEAKKLGVSDKIKVLLLPLTPTPVFFLLTKTDKGYKTVKQFDAINDGLYDTGVYDKNVEKYK